MDHKNRKNLLKQFTPSQRKLKVLQKGARKTYTNLTVDSESIEETSHMDNRAEQPII